jgi:hypothetical protein
MQAGWIREGKSMQGERENHNHGHVFWTGIGTYLLRGIWASQN